MKKILITGATGFIGSYFIDKYKATYDIETFSFLTDNIENLDLSSVDVIIHLSALVHQMGGATYSEYENINVTQTLELAQKAKKNGVGHFIFMSTVKVYGEETDFPYSEKSICLPIDDYGKSKLKAELELKNLHNNSFKLSIIRTPIVYGIGVKANIKNLIGLIKNINILPFKGIKNRRSMVYIGNLSHLIDEIIIKNKDGIFLASDDESLSTSQFIKLIAKTLDKKIYLIKIPFFEYLLKLIKPSFYKRLYQSLAVDNTQTKKELNYNNLYSVEEGIRFMINGEDK